MTTNAILLRSDTPLDGAGAGREGRASSLKVGEGAGVQENKGGIRGLVV